MKKILNTLPILALTLALFFIAKPILAAVRCEAQYGGGEVCVRTGELQIDKEVWDLQDNRYEDNLYLTSEDYQFGPGEIVTFILKITNVGDKTFDKVYVKDTLPEYLVLESGDLEFEIDNLDPGETEERTFEAKVVSADEFPDGATICVVNTAETWSGDEKDKDTAQVCIEEKVLGVTVLPPTGPENWLILLSLSLLTGLVGVYLRKFSI